MYSLYNLCVSALEPEMVQERGGEQSSSTSFICRQDAHRDKHPAPGLNVASTNPGCPQCHVKSTVIAILSDLVWDFI